MPSTGAEKRDAISTYSWAIEIQGITAGLFRECSGLGSENEIIENKTLTKDGKQIVHKTPGRLKWGDITLKRGMNAEMAFWDWRQQVVDGQIAAARKNISIILYDYDMKELVRWNVVNAWPSKYTGPSLNSGSSEAAVEEVTICHEGIERKK